jgi:hypothetical protein
MGIQSGHRGVQGWTGLTASARGNKRTAREFIDNSFSVHQAEQFPQLGVFRSRSLRNRDVKILLVAEDIAGTSHGGVVLFMQVRSVHGQLVERHDVDVRKMLIGTQVKVGAAVV